MAAETPIKVLGFAGSLRQGSFNRGVLRAAQALAPAGMTIETFDLSEIPLYNEDVRRQGFPRSVQAFREGIGGADAVLIVTPEYNYSMPGVLKNAIDWASRPPDQPFQDKPLAIMGASPSLSGTARAQHHLRQSFVFLDARVLARPEIMIPQVTDRFDEQGNLADETTRRLVAEQLVALAAWTRRLARGAVKI